MWNDWVMKNVRAARANGQSLSLAHLLRAALLAGPAGERPEIRGAAKRIDAEICSRLTRDRVRPVNADAVFNVGGATAAFTAYADAHAGEGGGSVRERVLEWLFLGAFSDKILHEALAICRKEGIDYSLASGRTAIANRGPAPGECWTFLDAETGPGDGALFGRGGDIQRQLGFLRDAVREGNHYLLEGQAGAGKTLFVQALAAAALRAWRVSPDDELRSIRFVMVTADQFSFMPRETERRVEALYSFLQENGNVVPVFDGFETFLNPRLPAHVSFASAFGGWLQTGGRTFVLVVRSGPALGSDLIKGIRVRSLSSLDAYAARQAVLARMETFCDRHDGWGFSPDKADFANRLGNLVAERYADHAEPLASLRLLDGACGRALAGGGEDGVRLVREDDLRRQVADDLGIPAHEIGADALSFHKKLSRALKDRVIGQDHAAETVCRALWLQTRRPPQRHPRGRFLFAGPPGVGKTEFARALAEETGMGREAFFHLNMAEYGTEHSRSRFLGSDPGFVGFKGTRTIFDMVRSRPSCVVLLDEVDRAHSSIQDILLAILEGQGRDSEGEQVRFSQAVFVMTTNLGQAHIESEYGRKVLAPPDAGGGMDRMFLAKNEWDDAKLRSLLLSGAESFDEQAPAARLDELARAAAGRAAAAERGSGEEAGALGEFVSLRAEAERLRSGGGRKLDRAFLDRVDLVIPFLPIKEPPLVRRILNQKLAQLGWGDAPERIREELLAAALRERESVRALMRLIMSRQGSEISGEAGEGW